MYSHYSAVAGLPSTWATRLDSAFDAAEENLWDDDDGAQRPAVPGKQEQELDTDYDPDPAQEATPLKNVPPRKKSAERSPLASQKPAKKR